MMLRLARYAGQDIDAMERWPLAKLRRYYDDLITVMREDAPKGKRR